MPRPSFIYGTAWKKAATADLVSAAAKAGFRAFDTANQPKHYQEALLGEALEAMAAIALRRDSVFVQTKFTPLPGHDHDVPYDPRADVATQVRQSFDSSLLHLKTDYVDSYLLHGPYSFPGLGEEDWQAWSAIEDIFFAKTTGLIGVSNFTAGQLEALVEQARVPPMVVQNRCYAVRGWDRDVREFCRAHGIMYQGFSLLTANRAVLARPEVASIATKRGIQPEQVIFRFAIQAGMVPLSGTTSERHMREDLGIDGIELTGDEMMVIETIAG
jgi:diketogulonate reductase-like aldo/keto reductase